MFSINDFRSELNEHDVLHGNRFIVEINPLPAKDRPGIGPEELISVEGAWDTIESRKILSLKAESVTLPGMFFMSADGLPPRFGYGTSEGIPYAPAFDPVTVNFAIDGKGEVYKFFYYWTSSIVNYKAKGQKPRLSNDSGRLGTYEVQYKDNYVRDITIKIYKPFHRPEKNEYLMKLTLYRAYPKDLPPNQMAWEEQNGYMKFPITFDYTDFDIEFPVKHK
jgi:hypothetical protein